MLNGGGSKKRKEDMNLQELFKDYYSKVKQQDPKEYVNSAKSSLNSFSSLLERRRQAASDKNTKKDATASTTQEAPKSQEGQTPDQEQSAKQDFSEAKPDEKSTAQDKTTSEDAGAQQE